MINNIAADDINSDNIDQIFEISTISIRGAT